MEQGVWQEIEQLYQKFQQLGISEAVDYEKYYLYSLITHSTAIEGSTLTEAEAQMLFDEGLTAKGKPLVYHLMNEDLKKAYELVKEDAKSKEPVNSAFLQKLNSALMRTTDSIYNVMGGSFDSSKGEFRLCGVTAGIGGCSYMSYQKVPAKVNELCALLQEKQKTVETFREQYELFPTKIFKEDREEYISALRQSQEEKTNLPFLGFMAVQLKKSLSLEIERFKNSQKRGFSFLF